MDFPLGLATQISKAIVLQIGAFFTIQLARRYIAADDRFYVPLQ